MKTDKKVTTTGTMSSKRSEDTIKIAATALLILAGAWLVLKISKEMLKELEGMGL